nr:unnamed protein product [Spirometra erinaceieuropaei]
MEIQADRQYPNSGLLLQTISTSNIIIIGICSHSLNIGIRRLFPWGFVVDNISCTILGADFLVAFILLVDCRQSLQYNMTNNLAVRCISSFGNSCQLAVLAFEPENTFRQLLAKYTGFTRLDLRASIPQYDVVHHIRTTGPLLFSRPRRLASASLSAAKAEFEYLLQTGMIRQSESPWALHMVAKATTGEKRPGGDYRALNNVTIADRYPALRLKDFASTLFGKSVFSKIDLVCALHQIPIAIADVSKTVVTPSFGLLEFLRMSFGLHKASQTCWRQMEHLATVLDRLLSPSSCVFCVLSLEFLRHLVADIRNFTPASPKRQLQRILGMVNFYRQFFLHRADIILPLTSLLSGLNGPFELSSDALAAFDRVEAVLANVFLLTYFSPCTTISLMVDTPNVAVGAGLQQQLANHT